VLGYSTPVKLPLPPKHCTIALYPPSSQFCLESCGYIILSSLGAESNQVAGIWRGASRVHREVAFGDGKAANPNIAHVLKTIHLLPLSSTFNFHHLIWI
jgi:hypothetical protein